MLLGTQFKRFQRFMSCLAQPSMEPQKSCLFSEASSPVLTITNKMVKLHHVFKNGKDKVPQILGNFRDVCMAAGKKCSPPHKRL